MAPAPQVFFDFMDVGPLRRAERAFYDVGVTVDEAFALLDGHIAHARELARFIVAHISSRVLGDPAVVGNGAFIDAIDLERLQFDPDAMRGLHSRTMGQAGYAWPFDASVLERFRTEVSVRS
jgi:hypothetical protein